MNQANRTKFLVELIKPSHYDDDGYLIQWWRGFVPSSSLSNLYGLALDAQSRRILGAGALGCFDAGRGCPFSCSFCTIINVQGRKSRYRSADDIEQLIRAHAAQGVKRFFITDDIYQASDSAVRAADQARSRADEMRKIEVRRAAAGRPTSQPVVGTIPVTLSETAPVSADRCKRCMADPDAAQGSSDGSLRPDKIP